MTSATETAPTLSGSELEARCMAAERFQALSEYEIAQLLTERTARMHRKQLKDADFYLTNI